ncbi:unnamed protein product [Calypogeia fissa]
MLWRGWATLTSAIGLNLWQGNTNNIAPKEALDNVLWEDFTFYVELIGQFSWDDHHVGKPGSSTNLTKCV